MSENPPRLPMSSFESCFTEAIRHHQAGRLQQAWDAYRRALAMQPRHPEALHRFGLLAHQLGQDELAAEMIENAIEASAPQVPPRYYGNLGLVLCQLGYAEDAERALRKALLREPRTAPWHDNLGRALYMQGRLTEAVGAWQRAIELDPASGAAWTNYGNALMALGRAREAMAAHRRATESGAQIETAWDNYLYATAFLPDPDPAFIRREHERWAAAWRRRAGVAQGSRSVDPSRDPERPLNLGFISADFRQHSVAYFIEPVLRHLDRSAFRVFCYANVRVPDETTARLRGYPCTWQSITGLDDAAAAQLVAHDRIDVLLDLGGHTAGNRLRVLGYRPAPVQGTYLGYPLTTGLPASTYRLTDVVSDPPGLTEAHYTETLLRLPVPSWCYQPPPCDVPVAPPPHERNGFITFGSFNTYNKTNERVLGAWARILNEVPGSHLLLKTRGLGDPGTRAVVLGHFEARGVPADRVSLSGFEPDTAAHLSRYAEVDIALDTFPYNGTTTTCEALWQGVPLIALEGDMHVSRVGLALLRALGLEEYVGRSVEDYIGLAVRLAREPARIKELRQGMRARMAGSVLCDQPGFARHFGAALREAWRAWCAGAQVSAGR